MLMLRVLSTKVFAQLKGCISTNTTQKNMTKREQISELNSLLLMMLPHPSNTLGSEFADRISGLIKVVSAMRDEAREEKDSIRIDFGKMREAYFNECVDKDSGRKLKVCLAPHDLFEWFKKELVESSKI